MSKIDIDIVVTLDNGIVTETRAFKGTNREYKAYKYILKQLKQRCIPHTFKKCDYVPNDIFFFDIFMEELKEVLEGNKSEIYWFGDII